MHRNMMRTEGKLTVRTKDKNLVPENLLSLKLTKRFRETSRSRKAIATFH